MAARPRSGYRAPAQPQTRSSKWSVVIFIDNVWCLMNCLRAQSVRAEAPTLRDSWFIWRDLVKDKLMFCHYYRLCYPLQRVVTSTAIGLLYFYLERFFSLDIFFYDFKYLCDFNHSAWLGTGNNTDWNLSILHQVVCSYIYAPLAWGQRYKRSKLRPVVSSEL